MAENGERRRFWLLVVGFGSARKEGKLGHGCWLLVVGFFWVLVAGREGKALGF